MSKLSKAGPDSIVIHFKPPVTAQLRECLFYGSHQEIFFFWNQFGLGKFSIYGIYVNDLHNAVKFCELNSYADDMKLHYSDVDLSCVESNLQEDLQSVNSWLCVNRLTLSIKKSNVMLIGSCQKLRNNDLRVTVDGKQLSRVLSVKYLGLHLDEHLTWHQHTTTVLQRVYSRIHCLYCLRPLPADLLSKLYNVFVLPILDYCDVPCIIYAT